MNPIVPVELPRSVLPWLDFACLAMFLISLALFKTRTRLSIASSTRPDAAKRVTVRLWG